MKKNRVFPALLALLMVLSLLAPAYAAGSRDSKVTYVGGRGSFEFEPGSYWTETDLFENFKGVMPGDVLYEEVTVQNVSGSTVEIFMGGLLHDRLGNPISPRVLEELIADGRKGTLSELEYMHDFLAQMTLTVWRGDMVDENIIYQGHPDTLEEGFEDGFVRLGFFSPGRSVKLNVRLEVPLSMSNRYSYRIGEVDWVFVVQRTGGGGGSGDDAFEPDPTPTPTPTPTPDPGPEPTPTPPGMSDVPQTGDNTVFWPFVALFAVGLIGMLITLLSKRKRKDTEE